MFSGDELECAGTGFGERSEEEVPPFSIHEKAVIVVILFLTLIGLIAFICKVYITFSIEEVIGHPYYKWIYSSKQIVGVLYIFIRFPRNTDFS